VLRFTEDGELITSWTIPAFPRGIAADLDGNVYVAERTRVEKYTGNGELITAWGRPGSGPGEFGTILGIAVDSFGRIFVLEKPAESGPRIQQFTSDGEFVAAFGDRGRVEDLLTFGRCLAAAAGRIYVSDSVFIRRFVER